MRRWKASLTLLFVILFGPASAMGEGRDSDPESQLLRLSEEIKRAKTEARYEAEQTVYTFTGEQTVVTRFRVQYAYPYRNTRILTESGKASMGPKRAGSSYWKMENTSGATSRRANSL